MQFNSHKDLNVYPTFGCSPVSLLILDLDIIKKTPGMRQYPVSDHFAELPRRGGVFDRGRQALHREGIELH